MESTSYSANPPAVVTAEGGQHVMEDGHSRDVTTFEKNGHLRETSG
jgi:hypothetical protein